MDQEKQKPKVNIIDISTGESDSDLDPAADDLGQPHLDHQVPDDLPQEEEEAESIDSTTDDELAA